MKKTNKEIIRYYNIHGVSLTDASSPVKFPSHWHNAAEFTLILKEGCRYRIGDTVYTPEPGDLLLIWPRELHETLFTPERASMFIQFSSGLLENNTDLVAASGFLKECHHISAKKDPELARKLTTLMNKIRENYRKKQYFVETRCKLLIYDMLILIGEYVMKEHREQIGNENFSDKSWDYIRAACSYVADHSSEDISQADAAAQIGLSPYYFSKLFNEYTQMTFPAYLAGIRVQNAINLLANDRYSITDCAFMSGFQSTTTFNKVFRETTGCTPREYRKLHKHGR
ncbi:MAG: AraC family transcriptional regulator [Lachnospiraceae bacterium]|nr:AraC family transcriptional regulator [Lachnospiraceae bacterium]